MQRRSECFAMATIAIVTLALTFLTCINGAPLETSNTTIDISNDTDLLIDNKEAKSPLLVNGLFEGDIKISEDLIIKNYNFSSIPEGEELLEKLLKARKTEGSGEPDLLEKLDRKERAAGSDITLWSGRIVRYEISSSISASTASLIRDAMDEWEANTCLRFYVRSGQTDYIKFRNDDDGCYSHIGVIGGQQTINLESPGCETLGIILHEIGHAIGFWHEQSRPDRNNYVSILWDNIEDGRASAFMVRDHLVIDYQGSGYDYGSIMQYRHNAFSSCSGCSTIVINNNAEYESQGSPTIGQRVGLSTRDIEQANRLYNCPGSGEYGFLAVKIKQGYSLPNANEDPYVKITFVRSTGSQYNRQTSVVYNTQYPVWNEWVYVPQCAWQFFRLRVRDEDGHFDDHISMSETVIVEPGTHYNQRHCVDTACSGYVTYDYRLFTVPERKLRVKVRYARNLRDTDPIGNPDPYVKVYGVQATTSETYRRTSVEQGTEDPTWNEWLDFGCARWTFIKIQIWDEDVWFDDRMSDKETVLLYPGTRNGRRHDAYDSGYLIYDYQLPTPDPTPCSPNPCQHGGTCVDQRCGDFTCSCSSGWGGSNCQYRSGNLRIYARYGRNLQDRDPWWNDSDPYMEVIAYDRNGNSVRMTTSTRHGDQSPDWNQWLNFGTRTWREFRVRIWDEDVSSDDALSSSRTWTLNSFTTQTFVHLSCYGSGYVRFDYRFT